MTSASITGWVLAPNKHLSNTKQLTWNLEEGRDREERHSVWSSGQGTGVGVLQTSLEASLHSLFCV